MATISQAPSVRATVGQPADPVDPWSIVSGNDYDIDTLYLRATDGKGHSVNVQAPVSTNLYGTIQAIVQHPDTQYRTMQDFVRDAMAHRARYWSEVEKAGRLRDLPGAAEAIEMEAFQSDLDKAKARREHANTLLQAAEREFDEVIRQGAIDRAGDVLERIGLLVETWEDMPSHQVMMDSMTRMRTAFHRARQQ